MSGSSSCSKASIPPSKSFTKPKNITSDHLTPMRGFETAEKTSSIALELTTLRYPALINFALINAILLAWQDLFQ